MVLIGLTGIVSLTAFLAYALNQYAVRSTTHLFESVLEDRKEAVGEMVLEYGYWDAAVENVITSYDPDWIQSNFGTYLFDVLSVSRVFVIAPSNETVVGFKDGELNQLDAFEVFGSGLLPFVEDARATPDNLPPKPVSGIVDSGTSSYLLAAVRMTTYTPEADISTDHVIILAQDLDQDWMNDVSESYLLPGLRLSDRPPMDRQAGIRLVGSDGQERLYFVWDPGLPGLKILPRVFIGIGVALLMIFGTIYWFARRVRRVAQDLEKARAAADDANIAKTEFLRQVTHELRTPMNAVIGFADVIQNQIYGSLNHQKYLEYSKDIYKAGSHMLTLVNNLLDLEKINAGALEIKLEDVAVSDIVHDALSYIGPAAEQKSIAFEVAITPSLQTITTDRQIVRQCLLNLLSNAVKFTPDGGKIACYVQRKDRSWIEFIVEDSGIGIPSDQIEHVLEPFGQIEDGDTDALKGTGLGLPITKRLAELLGGKFTLESEQSQGTTATIVLPV